ncbi:MAG TPA: myxosortase-dependent metalloprotease, MXAN_2677/MXAN_2678 family, partial [Myxococcaceae bacterium]|nr:myxosortase-dependent metalloprotease, MXAN_2677/MXAN_2678 family [Myxococcaceae bacterium]
VPYRRTRVREPQGVPAAERRCLWWEGGGELVYRQNASGNPATPGDAEFQAVQSSFATWNRAFQGCGNLTFREGPRSSDRVNGYREEGGDNVNQVIFRTQRCSDVAPEEDPCWSEPATCQNRYDCWSADPLAIAVTVTTYDMVSGQILDGDIELNAAHFFFTAVDGPRCNTGEARSDCVATDVENTVTHEIGHFIGLDHTRHTDSTMASRAVEGETSKRTLDPGTQQAVCDLYPQGRPTLECEGQGGTPPPPSTGCGAAAGATGAGPLLMLALWWRRRRHA